MALEPDRMAWDVVLIVVEGVILALVLNKWNDYTVQRREERKTKELVIEFHKLLSEKDVLNLYYLLV